MTSEGELLAQFQHKAVIPSSGALYFPVDAAGDILEKCREYGLAMVGIEGNRIEEDVVYSRSDMIYDVSRRRAKTWAEYARACNDEAEGVLHELANVPDLLLWLTIIEEDAWHR